MTLREIVDMLRETYTGAIGSEFLHISEVEEKRWCRPAWRRRAPRPSFVPRARGFLERLRGGARAPTCTPPTPGQKRFSLEGGETTITALDTIIQRGGARGIEEIVIGMAHRGRLNVLVNIMGKSPKDLFAEFEGMPRLEGRLGRRRSTTRATRPTSPPGAA